MVALSQDEAGQGAGYGVGQAGREPLARLRGWRWPPAARGFHLIAETKPAANRDRGGLGGRETRGALTMLAPRKARGPGISRASRSRQRRACNCPSRCLCPFGPVLQAPEGEHKNYRLLAKESSSETKASQEGVQSRLATHALAATPRILRVDRRARGDLRSFARNQGKSPSPNPLGPCFPSQLGRKRLSRLRH